MEAARLLDKLPPRVAQRCPLYRMFGPRATRNRLPPFQLDVCNKPKRPWSSYFKKLTVRERHVLFMIALSAVRDAHQSEWPSAKRTRVLAEWSALWTARAAVWTPRVKEPRNVADHFMNSYFELFIAELTLSGRLDDEMNAAEIERILDSL